MSCSGSEEDEFAVFGRPTTDGCDGHDGDHTPTDPEPVDDDASLDPRAGLLVGDIDHRTRLLRPLSSGSFGDVYVGELGETERRVAVKLERQGTGVSEQLLYEGNVYRRLEDGPGIARLHWFGLHPAGLNVLVLDLLGPSLYDLLVRCGGRLSLKSVLLLLDQLFHSIEFVHERGFVHRDISPNNLLMGRPGSDDEHRLFLVDFGLSKQFCSGPRYMPAGRRPVRYTRPVVGTMRFASRHAHTGEEVGRRDDLEAIGYLAVYLLLGRLPWQGLQADTAIEKFNAIARVKTATSAQDLCQDLPPEFAIYVDYTRQLKLYDVPDYDSIRTMFRDLAARLQYDYDDRFDWQATDEVAEATKCRTPSGDSGIADMAEEDVC